VNSGGKADARADASGEARRGAAAARGPCGAPRLGPGPSEVIVGVLRIRKTLRRERVIDGGQGQ
jgi:hypothetical protein